MKNQFIEIQFSTFSFPRSLLVRQIVQFGISFLICQVAIAQDMGRAPLMLAGNSQFRIASYLETLCDSSCQIPLEEIVTEGYSQQFEPLRHPSLRFGFREDCQWIKLKVVNSLNQTSEYALVLPEPKINEILFFALGEPPVISGARTPISRKVLSTPMQVFPFTLEPYEEKILYVRIKGSGVTSQVSVQSLDSLKNLVTKQKFYSGILAGFLGLVIIYCISLFLSIREPLFLIYASVVFVLAVCNLSLEGSIAFFSEWAGQNTNLIFGKFGHLANPLIQWYGMRFLQLPLFAPKGLLKMHRFLLALYLSTTIGVWFVPSGLGIISMQTHGVVLFITLILTAIYVWKKGNRYAIFLALGCGSYLLGIFLEIGYWQGLILHAGFLNYVSYGQVLEIIILTVALNGSIRMQKRRLEKERKDAYELALGQSYENERMVAEQNIKLEEMVKNRTQELSKRNKELQEMDEAKNKFFSILSHDLRGPLGSLNATLELFENKQFSESELTAILSEISKSTCSLNDLLNNLLFWAKDQLKEYKVRPVNFEIEELIQQNIDLLYLQANDKGIVINNQSYDSLYVKADRDMIDFVLRNLVSNSIKFTEKGGSIGISAHLNNGFVQISIIDNGIGMNPSKLKKLFTNDALSTKGTAQEIGTGLGLQLVKEFVERNGGKIEVKSVLGEGSEFIVYLRNAFVASEITAN